ncbi:MAG: hypothetical protein RLZZ627_618 [Pseudomonadota bacterium]|jgi:NodT family efflux transporter outer membrane factor (OMF) lipoprotein
MPLRTPKSAIFGIVCTLSGCAVGPDYVKPSSSVPEHWPSEKEAGARLKPIQESDLETWWRTLNDPVLDELEQRGKAGNLDLKVALTRIDQARAEKLANRASLFPQVGATAAGTYLDNVFPRQTNSGTQNQWGFLLTGLDAFWEIDLFGRLRRKLEASSALNEGAAENYREAWVLLSSEIAKEYVTYRNLQSLLRITRSNIKAQSHTLNLTERLFVEGVGTRFDTTREKSLLKATEAEIPRLEGLLSESQHKIELLLATQPGSLRGLLEKEGTVPVPTDRRILVKPADTLRLRPDIREAERNLAAATATQGAAFAELFPKISVAAFMGVQNSDLENLFRSTAFSWASGSAIMQPIFNFGRIRAGIDLADSRQKEAYFQYEKTILEALKETETGLRLLLKEEERRQNLEVSVENLRESRRLAELRYREGISNFLDVLDSERAIYTEEIRLAQCRAQTTIYLISVFKALGGAGNFPVDQPDEPIRPWG